MTELTGTPHRPLLGPFGFLSSQNLVMQHECVSDTELITTVMGPLMLFILSETNELWNDETFLSTGDEHRSCSLVHVNSQLNMLQYMRL